MVFDISVIDIKKFRLWTPRYRRRFLSAGTVHQWFEIFEVAMTACYAGLVQACAASSGLVPVPVR